MPTRRQVLQSTAAAFTLHPLLQSLAHAAEKTRPNILWIFGDDLGVELGCYGYAQARTPNIDRLASQGCRFANAFTTAPVCSASRSALITGMYATSIGAHHHRSHRTDGYHLPAPVQIITDLFRQAGYFTANVTTPAPGLKCGGKTDFNFKLDQKPFDGTDWNQRKPGQPFYAQINFSEPHRSFAPARKQLKELTDPAKVVLPPCYPEHPIIRDDWAAYLDAIALLDQKVGKVLKRLDDEGLAENTIIFFIGDNGQCHVRGKQFLYDGGIHVPLIVRHPGAIKPNTVSDDLISGIDVSATSLQLAGIAPPSYMQGQTFLGSNTAPPRKYIFAARDRCDETMDRIRCVRSKQYKYIRNFMPDRPYTQPNAYKERQYPALAVMKQLHAEGKLTPEQAAFMASRRPEEELYDLSADPHELKNLATSPQHQTTLTEMRQALTAWIKETRDQGETPEDPKAANPN